MTELRKIFLESMNVKLEIDEKNLAKAQEVFEKNAVEPEYNEEAIKRFIKLRNTPFTI